MKYVLYMHYGSGNHGCEAIVKTTSELLGNPKDNILWSLNRDEDIHNGVDQYYSEIVVSEQLNKYSIPYFEALFQRKILKRKDANRNVFIRELFKDNIALCVGGDNYCYTHSAKQAVNLNREIRKYARATVLWGCSIEESALTPDVVEDLKKYDLITAREQVTYEMLKRINSNTVKVADPAFILNTDDIGFPQSFNHNNIVGINISPLIMKYSEGENIVLKNYTELIHYILEETDLNIAFIPHVFWKDNSDLETIYRLITYVQDTKYRSRFFVVTKGNANQLKGYISKCRFFVGARTHATIAAYSSCVPTLAVGYSVKAIGIARDLFNCDDHYVLPVQKMTNENDLIDDFKWLLDNEKNIRSTLKIKIPDYIKMSRFSSEVMVELLKKVA